MGSTALPQARMATLITSKINKAIVLRIDSSTFQMKIGCDLAYHLSNLPLLHVTAQLEQNVNPLLILTLAVRGRPYRWS
jgi:hypothetical protein